MTKQEPRWYSVVNNMGMATLCADKADAEDVASTCDIDFPRQSPHRAVQLVEVSELDAERAARIEAQQRLADMQELAAKSGLAHRMAVQEDVSDAMKRMQAGEKLSYTDKEVELIMLGWQSELQKAVAAERDACAEIAADDDHIVDVPGYYAQLGDANATAYNIEKAIRARGTP